VTVNFATVNGTARTNDNDYVARSGTLSFAPGETRKVISVVINGDKKKEKNETFYVKLSQPVNASIDTIRAAGSIWNDDGVSSTSQQLSFASATDEMDEDFLTGKKKKRLWQAMNVVPQPM
jgi:hypothetical protein